MTEKTAATLTIFEGARMTMSGRREIANWMRRQANFLENHGDELSKRYSARYKYQEDTAPWWGRKQEWEA
jgi:hypothetical protein